MPYRRRTTRARRPGRPRGGNRYRARRNMLRRGRIYSNRRPFFYKQSIDGTMIRGLATRTITQTLSPRYIGCEFNMDQLPQWNAFSSLYDQYCVSKVVIKLTPMVNVNNVQPLAGVSLSNPGILATVLDDDDPSAPTSLAQLQQYQSFKSQPAMSTRAHYRVFVPGTKTENIVNGGGFAPAGIAKKKWLDCSYGNASFYGLKIYLDAYGNVNAPACYQVEGYVYLKFRNVR